MPQETVQRSTERPPLASPFAEQWDTELSSTNPLRFPAYTAARQAEESVRTGLVRAPGGNYVLIECDFSRSGGTMGAVAGERVTRAYERATRSRLPVAQIVSSGGARLQEGFFALVQMARTASAQAAHQDAGLMSAVVFRSPSTGGVFASWGSGADVKAAAPAATIGFGGPRVVHSVTGQFPPPTSHNAESAFAAGLLDAIVPESGQIDWLERTLGLRPASPLPVDARGPRDPAPTADAWHALLQCRSPSRPSGLEWAAWLTDGWTELRGPGRRFRAGIGKIGNRRTMFIAMDRDRSGGELSLPRPEDFRLARRAIALAGRLGLPLVTLIDTPGADPSPSSEAGGLAHEISRTLLDMAGLPTPSAALCVGEGGSGGAMALAHADTLLMLKGSVFAVIGPEAGATVLYRDRERAPELAAAMGILPAELAEFGFVDAVLPNSIAEVRAAILGALDPSRVGQRHLRPTRATRAAVAGFGASEKETQAGAGYRDCDGPDPSF
jgi:acetyl-CoA carboxylase carboxyl transferase subunit beta